MSSIRKGSLVLAMIASLSGVTQMAEAATNCGPVLPDAFSKNCQCFDDVRYTTTGHAFVRDYSYPAFGESWRDPSGLVWSTTFTRDGNIARLSYTEAENLCARLGTRLPTREEFERLRAYMTPPYGVVNGEILDESGYRPQILPRLDPHFFWSSTLWHEPRAVSGPGRYYFFGATGQIGYTTVTDSKLSVRCVFQR